MERFMDFVERIFGISPDGGSGSYELLLFLIPIVAVVILWRARTVGRAAVRRRKD
jgi:hypothetical protein